MWALWLAVAGTSIWALPAHGDGMSPAGRLSADDGEKPPPRPVTTKKQSERPTSRRKASPGRKEAGDVHIDAEIKKSIEELLEPGSDGKPEVRGRRANTSPRRPPPQRSAKTPGRSQEKPAFKRGEVAAKPGDKGAASS